MLQLKFQTLTPAQCAAVEAADTETLEEWTVALLTVPTAEALFES